MVPRVKDNNLFGTYENLSNQSTKSRKKSNKAIIRRLRQTRSAIDAMETMLLLNADVDIFLWNWIQDRPFQ